MIIARFFRFLTLIFLVNLSLATLTFAQPINVGKSSVRTTSKKIRHLLTYDDFLNLSDDQKLAYIDTVRKLALDLSLNPHFISATDLQDRTKLDQFLSLWLQEAHASEYENLDRECTMDRERAKSLSDQDLLSEFGLTLNCKEIKSKLSDPNVYRPPTIQRVESLSAEFFARLESRQITPRTQHYGEAIGALQAAISEVKTNGTKNQKVSSTWLSDDYNRLSILEQKTSAGYSIGRKSAPAKATSETANSDKSEKPAPKKAEAEKPATTRGPEPQEQSQKTDKAETKPETSSFKDDLQCLYAGFVIPKGTENKCHPYKELPFTSDFLNKKTFVCPQAQQILCNPLLFGYEETNCKSAKLKTCDGKRPICVFRSQDATKNCYDLAKRKKTLKQTMELWKSPEGEKLYHDYVESLEDLCDAGHLESRKLRTAVFADITKTCEVAFSVLKDNIQSEFLPAKLSPEQKSSGKR